MNYETLTVTLEDHFLTGGLYSIVAELCLREGVTGKVLPFALKERWFSPGLLPDVLEHEGFTGAHFGFGGEGRFFPLKQGPGKGFFAVGRPFEIGFIAADNRITVIYTFSLNADFAF